MEAQRNTRGFRGNILVELRTWLRVGGEGRLVAKGRKGTGDGEREDAGGRGRRGTRDGRRGEERGADEQGRGLWPACRLNPSNEIGFVC